ncbi:MAG: HepT-like ribonuclease domain-containing protein [Tsuneonella sp.]
MIGEAARRLSDTSKARNPDINWSAIVAMRNIIAHDYEGIAATVMWRAAKDELNSLSRVCRTELQTLGEDAPDE